MAKAGILVADTDSALLSDLAAFLVSEGYEVFKACDPKRVLEVCGAGEVDVVLISRKMVRDCPGAIIGKIRQSSRAAIIEMVEFGDDDVEGNGAGCETLVKPFSHRDLGTILRLVLNNKRLAEEIADLRTRNEFQDELVWVAGKGRHIEELLSSLDAATCDGGAVLVQGEEGTDRETVARIIHSNYFGNSGPFVTMSCRTLTEEGISRELFGRGSKRQSSFGAGHGKGRVELADGGTLFIEGIDGVPPSVQIRLLNLIAESGFENDDGEWIPVSASIVLGASSNLDQLVEQGEFRADLYYRISRRTVRLKPLREIRDALPDIVACLLAGDSQGSSGTTRLGHEAARILQDYDWPGNHAELMDAVKYALARCANGEIAPHHLPSAIAEGAEVSSMLSNALDAVEKRHISHVLEKCLWNKHQAARELEISKSTLYSKIGKYRLSQKEHAGSQADA